MRNTSRKMADVLVVPVFVEIPSGFERSLSTLEDILRRAGYAFSVGEPLSGMVETAAQTFAQQQNGEFIDGRVG